MIKKISSCDQCKKSEEFEENTCHPIGWWTIDLRYSVTERLQPIMICSIGCVVNWMVEEGKKVSDSLYGREGGGLKELKEIIDSKTKYINDLESQLIEAKKQKNSRPKIRRK